MRMYLNLKKLLQLTRNQLIVYETLFPWLEEFKEMPEKDINQLVSEDSIEGYERVKYFLYVCISSKNILLTLIASIFPSL